MLGALDVAECVHDLADGCRDLRLDAVDLGDESADRALRGLAQDFSRPDHQAVWHLVAPRVEGVGTMDGDEARPVLALAVTTSRPEAGCDRELAVEERQALELVVVDEVSLIVEFAVRAPVARLADVLDLALERLSRDLHVPRAAQFADLVDRSLGQESVHDVGLRSLSTQIERLFGHLSQPRNEPEVRERRNVVRPSGGDGDRPVPPQEVLVEPFADGVVAGEDELLPLTRGVGPRRRTVAVATLRVGVRVDAQSLVVDAHDGVVLVVARGRDLREDAEDVDLIHRDLRRHVGQLHGLDGLAVDLEAARLRLEFDGAESPRELALVHLPRDLDALAPVAALARVLLVVCHGDHGEGLVGDDHELVRVGPVVCLTVTALVDRVDLGLVLFDADHAHELRHRLRERTEASVRFTFGVDPAARVLGVRGEVRRHVRANHPLAVRDLDLGCVLTVSRREHSFELHGEPRRGMCTHGKATATLPALPIS